MRLSRSSTNLRASIPETRLHDLYVRQGLTIEQAASQLGVAPTTIRRRLKDVGIQARRRGPVVRSRSPLPPLEWTADRAYVVGLIATDGNLSRKRGRLTLTSNDVDLLDVVRQRLAVRAPIAPHAGGYGHRCHRLAWSDLRFYNWLLAIGLTPAKSLTLGPLAVPDAYFADFLRGCIDGDGSVVTYTDRYHMEKDARYVYDRLYVSLVSASHLFIHWIQTRVHRLIGLRGAIDSRQHQERRTMWSLRYAKAESIRLLRWMYYAPDVACLQRKRAIAHRFLQPLGYAPARPVGRPRVGWLYNGVSDAAQ